MSRSASQVNAAGNPDQVQRGEEQLQAQRTRSSDRRVEVTSRPHERFVRTCASLRFLLHVAIEGQRRTDEQLLQTVVEGLGELLARVLLGERQVRRHLAQLSRPPFEFDRAFPQRSVAVSKRHFTASLRSVTSTAVPT